MDRFPQFRPLLSLLRSLLALVIALGPLACAEPPTPVSLWGGFDYTWERLSHRISYFESAAGPTAPDGSFPMSMGMIGGPWSMSSALPEVVNYRAPWWWAQSPSLRGHSGTVEFSIGADGEVLEPLRLDLESVGMDGFELITVALSGLSWDTDVEQVPEFPPEYDPAEGWTPQSLGAGIDDIQVSGGQLQFTPWLRFRPGPLDREDMNEALAYMTVSGTLYYTVLAADGVLTEGKLENSALYPIDPPNSLIPELDPADRRVHLAGEPGLPAALPIVRSWMVDLNRDLGQEGRYLRALSVASEEFDYSPESGAADWLLDTYCSHSSAIEEGDLQVEFQLDLALLQLRSKRSIVVAGELAGSGPVGPFTEQVVP